MLLPIVLALAGAASVQPAGNMAAVNVKQFSAPDQIQALEHSNRGDGFVHKFNDGAGIDRGMIVSHQKCGPNQECSAGCLSITAYVYSDGENPHRQYVTDCPNLEVPYQMKRAHQKHSGTDDQPRLKRTN
jgi:hypothetical protein